MYKSYKYTKQTRDIFFQEYNRIIIRWKMTKLFQYSEWWFGNSKSKFPSGDLEIPSASTYGILVLHKVYSIDCPVGYYGENFLSPLKYGSHCAKDCLCSCAWCHHIYVCNRTTVSHFGASSAFYFIFVIKSLGIDTTLRVQIVSIHI